MEPRFVHDSLVVPRATALSGAMLPLLVDHFLLLGLLVGRTVFLWAELFTALGLSKGTSGSAQLVAAVFSVALLIVGRQLTARLGKKILSLAGLALLCGAMLALALVDHLVVRYGGRVLLLISGAAIVWVALLAPAGVIPIVISAAVSDAGGVAVQCQAPLWNSVVGGAIICIT